MKKIIRITTVPSSLHGLLTGQLKFMSNYFNIIGVSSNGDKLNLVRENEGIETYAIDMTRSISPVKDLIATYKLYKFLKKEKPDIVHTHTPKAGTLGMIAAKFAGVPQRLHTIAGLPLLEATGLKRLLLNTVEKITYSCATHILPNSYGLKSIILDNKFTNASKLKVIGNGSSNGIDTSYFDIKLFSDQTRTELRKKLNINEKDTVFLFIGRMVRDKGLNELVQAFNELSKTNLNCKLIFVGPREDHLDPLTEETENIIETNEQILSVGFQQDVRPFLSISNVLVHPSYREGFPNVVLQAGSMKLPCIVSNINGSNEIIEHNKNGLIVPVKDKISLKNAMNFMIDNPEKRSGMSNNSRPIIKKQYQRQYIWNELLNFYNRLD
jgi:glycosyltransferase involved in cell wall biosynthesis